FRLERSPRHVLRDRRRRLDLDVLLLRLLFLGAYADRLVVGAAVQPAHQLGDLVALPAVQYVRITPLSIELRFTETAVDDVAQRHRRILAAGLGRLDRLQVEGKGPAHGYQIAQEAPGVLATVGDLAHEQPATDPHYGSGPTVSPPTGYLVSHHM